jgi:flagellar basal-body rod modification protein FlgD
MSTVQNAVSATSTLAASTAAPASTTSSDIQDRFLKLLVTQLKNQDPLNPLDNAQLTSQLSQISTVTGIEKLNTSLQTLSSSLLSSQSLQATGLIGHTVLTEGSSLAFNGSVAAGAGIELPQSADSVKVDIIGPAGNVVRQLDLGARQAGLVNFQWNGLSEGGTSAAAGNYSFQVTATSGGQKVPVTSLMSGVVSSVTLGADGVHANVTGLGDVPMRNINRIM